jgi:uncharacterized membrane protein
VVEGLVNHQLLGLHHVRPGPDELLYDIGFLVWGAVMLAVGGALVRQTRTSGPPRVGSASSVPL